MGKIHKQLKKVLLLAMAFTLLLSAGIVAAASGGTPLRTLQAEENNKRVSKYTLYTNGDSAVVSPENLSANFKGLYTGNAEAMTAKKTVFLEVNASFTKAKGQEDSWTVSSSNQRVVSVVKTTENNKKGIALTAKGNGTATVTLKDKFGKKTAKVKVTVKTLAKEIAFGSNVAVDAGTKANNLTIAKGGSLSLNASVLSGLENINVSSQKLKYAVVEGKGNVTVNGKGVVTGKKINTDAKILVYALDQACKFNGKKVNAGNSAVIQVHVNEGSAVDSLKLVNTGSINKNKIELKTNATSAAHTYQFTVYGEKGGNELSSDQYIFTSSKPAVATVTRDGLITGCANGTAKITASPADGSKGKNKTVTITAKVTTDVDTINVPSNVITVPLNKTAKIGATVDKKASNKKLQYKVISGDDALAVSCMRNGFLKGASVKASKDKLGTAVIEISVKDDKWNGVSRIVKVNVVDPIKKITSVKAERGFISGTDKSKNGIDSKISLYVGAEGSGYDTATLKLTADTASNNKKTADDLKKILSYTSSKPAVATVDKDGVITAKSKGSAKITIKATDGSNKKATVTVNVVQLVTDIQVAGVRSAGSETRLDVLKDTKNVTLNVTTNANAYKKNLSAFTNAKAMGLNWSPDNSSGVTVTNNKNKLSLSGSPEGAEQRVGTFTFTANRGLVNNEDQTKGFLKEVKVAVYVVDKAAFESNAEAVPVTVKKGETLSLQEALADKTSQKNLTWRVTSGKSVTVKNGVVTGKRTGISTVTATAVRGSERNEFKFEIAVTESQADFVKALDAKVKALAAAEDYTVWAGMKPTFNAKTATIQLTAKNLSNLHFRLTSASLNKEGLIDAAKESVEEELTAVFTGITEGVLDKSYVGVSVTSGNMSWSIVREGTDLKVKRGADVVAVYSALPSPDEAVENAAKALAKRMVKDADSWAGKDLSILLTKAEVPSSPTDVEYPAAIYEKEYFVHFAPVAQAEVDSLIDTTITSELGIFKEKNAAHKEATGIDDVNYYPASNMTVIDIYNGNLLLDDLAKKGADAADSKGLTADTLQRVIDKIKEAKIVVENANMTITGANITPKFIDSVKKNGVDKELSDIDVINAASTDITNLTPDDILKKIRDMLADYHADQVQSLHDLNGLRFTVRATGSLNGMEFTEEYHIIFNETFTRTLEALNAEVETAAGKIQTVDQKADSPIGKAAYTMDADGNGKLTLSVKTLDAKGTALQGVGLKDFVNVILNTKVSDGADIIAKGSAQHISKGKELSTDDVAGMKEFMDAFKITEDTPLSDVIGRTITIRVYYGSSNVGIYSIVFEKDANASEQPETPTPDNPTPDNPTPEDPKTDDPADPAVQAPAEVTVPEDTAEVPAEEEVSELDVSAEETDEVEASEETLDEAPVPETDDISEAA